MNVLLIGPRGSGKSTIGRRLAKLAGKLFIDTDEHVLACFDEPTVSAVWAAHGEGPWREAEAGVVRDLLRRDGQIIALGGGAPLVPAVRETIERDRAAGRARVIHLACPAQELQRRLRTAGGSANRPSLTGSDPVDEVESVLTARLPMYRRLADHELDVGSLNAEDATREALALIR